MKNEIKFLTLSACMVSISAFASPGAHGPAAGNCDGHTPDNNTAWQCVEVNLGTAMTPNWYHVTEGGWFGHDGTDDSDFVFEGSSALACGILSANCTLTLHGQVRINTEVGDDLGVKVLHGSVTGGGLCGAIDLQQFPWYAADGTEHSTFNDGSYISSEGSLDLNSGYASGNMGLIGLGLPLIPDLANTHMHDVRFYNDGRGDNSSYFWFNGDLLDSGDNSSGCSVNGALYITGGYDLDANGDDTGPLVPVSDVNAW